MYDFFEGCLVTGVYNPFVPVPVCVPVPDFLRTFAFSGTGTGTHTGTKGLCKPVAKQPSKKSHMALFI